MTKRHKYTTSTLVLIGLIGAAYFVNTVMYPRFFDIEWDEEVQLHDGQTIIVHIKRIFERLGNYSGDSVQRDTEVSFDAGGKIGIFSQRFRRYDIDFIHRKDGYWYIYLINTTGTPPVKLVDWSAGFLIINPEGAIRKATSWTELPTEFKTRNIMPATPDANGISKFNGSRLTHIEKIKHWKQFPGGAGDDEILRRP